MTGRERSTRLSNAKRAAEYWSAWAARLIAADYTHDGEIECAQRQAAYWTRMVAGLEAA